MAALNYTSLLVWVLEKLEGYIRNRKAGQKELKELQEKLEEAIKIGHDSALTSIQYLTPLIMTIKANTCTVELKNVLSSPAQVRANPPTLNQ